jgi:hypothetical protein
MKLVPIDPSVATAATQSPVGEQAKPTGPSSLLSRRVLTTNEFLQLNTLPANTASPADAPAIPPLSVVIQTLIDRAVQRNQSSAGSTTFFACDMERSLMAIARALDERVPQLCLKDRIVFCFVPLSGDNTEATRLVCEWAAAHSEGGPVHMKFDQEVAAFVENSDTAPPLERLEFLYRMTEVYCWLGWRFSRTFADLEKGKEVKAQLVRLIAQSL